MRYDGSGLTFLWSKHGSLPLRSDVDNEVALDAFAAILDRQWKPVADRGGDFIAFDAPIWVDFMAPNWLALVCYDRGWFWIDRREKGVSLRYALRSWHTFVFCCGAALFFTGFAVFAGDLWAALWMGPASFAWLYGGNMVIANVAAPDLVRRTIENAGLQAATS